MIHLAALIPMSALSAVEVPGLSEVKVHHVSQRAKRIS